MNRNPLWPSVLLVTLGGFLSSSSIPAFAQPTPEPTAHGTVASLPPDAQITIVNQLAKLTASAGAPGDYFGFSAAISGNTVVVGAPHAAVGSNSDQGAAYVFVKPATGWANMTETAKLTASDGGANSFFGTAVAISGNTIVVEAGDGGSIPVYVFVEPSTGWADVNETAKLNSPTDYFGGGASPSVATNGKTVVLGVPWTPYQNSQFEGVVYIFVEPAGGWTGKMGESARLVLSNGFEDIFFGKSVSISGDTVVAGASASPAFNGAAYLFVKPSTGWAGTQTETATLTASNNDELSTVSISGNTVAAGAPGATVGSNVAQGAVYVFVKPAAGWVSMTETAKLTASDGASGDNLGASVTIGVGGNEVAAGADGRNSDTGAVYSFIKPSTGWTSMTQSSELVASDGATGDWLGASTSIAGGQIVAGAPQFDISEPGAAYLFGKQ